jgi:ornithine cyclodeaminase/alanine dehydrogenase-like protein (mu-crystallin family)
MRVLSHDEVLEALTPAACREAMRVAMVATSARDCVLPLRQFMPVPGRAGKLGLMPGYLGADADVFGVKIVSKYVRLPGDPHGTHVGAVMLFDAEHGLPRALLDGASLTAVRTAATTALATEALARPDVKTLSILGAGEEARFHLRALSEVRRFERVRVWARRPQQAEALLARSDLGSRVQLGVAHSAEEAVREADVLCTVTSAAEPIVDGGWLTAGVHVNLVGSAIPTTAEADVETVRRSRFFVDYREAALAQAGELRRAIDQGVVAADHIAGELGDVLAGRIAGRRNAQDITLYKSLGITTQDLAAAQCALREAERRDLGRVVEL